jgi:hypothetical protein
MDVPRGVLFFCHVRVPREFCVLSLVTWLERLVCLSLSNQSGHIGAGPGEPRGPAPRPQPVQHNRDRQVVPRRIAEAGD